MIIIVRFKMKMRIKQIKKIKKTFNNKIKKIKIKNKLQKKIVIYKKKFLQMKIKIKNKNLKRKN